MIRSNPRTCLLMFYLLGSFWFSPTIWAATKPSDFNKPSLVLMESVLNQPSHDQRALGYRFIPRFSSKSAHEKTLELFSTAPSSRLRKELVLGMGESGNHNFSKTLISYFRDAKPEEKAAIAKTLGKLKAKQGFPILKNFINTKANWYDSTSVTQEVIITLGLLGQQNTDKLLEPLFDEFSHPNLFGLNLYREPQKDQLAGALAWAYGDLNLFEKKKRFIDELFKSKSPKGSIMAAKTLLQSDNNEEAKIYLSNLLNNPNVHLDLRILTARALTSCLGLEAYPLLLDQGIQSNQIRLAMLKELSMEKMNVNQINFLLKSPDESLLSEGALHLAQLANPTETKTIENRFLEVQSPLARAVLRYTWEAINSE